MLRRSYKNFKPKCLALGAFAIALTLVGAVASPANSSADEITAIGYTYGDSGEKVYYEKSQIKEMLNAGYSGKVVYLNNYVGYCGTIDIQDGKSITIEMNGHELDGDGDVPDRYESARVTLGEGSNLTLKGGETAKYFTYTDHSNGTTEGEGKKIYSGGAVLGKAPESGNMSKGGCVEMGDNSTLTLDHVALLGGRVTQGGGVRMGDGAVLNMINGATITGCYAGGGGAIAVVGDEAKINMSGNSTIEGNGAGAGGGVFFEGSEFEFNSSDSTAKITKNTAYSSGGICVAQNFGTNEGTISNVTITENTASGNGGGVGFYQEWTTLKNCTITNNTAGTYGGGIYDDNDDNMVNGCTIQNNTAGSEGGGAFVYYKHDLRTGGVLTIDGNKRTDGADDDVFLDSSSSNDTWAYLYGDVDMGSHVGVRTGVTGDRRIVIKKSRYDEGTFFLNTPKEHWLSYRKSDKELWQSVQTTEMKYLVTINGEGTERYDTGETVTADAGKNDSYMTGNVFSHWDATSTTGFSPIEKFINDDTAYNSKLTFTMPNNDVHLKAVYCDPVAQLNVYVDEPVAGKALATEALVSMVTEKGSAVRSIIGTDEFKWYKKTSSGELVEASGVAEYGCTYVFEATFTPDTAKGLVYKGNSVTEKTGSRLYAVSGSAASSDDKTAYRGMNPSTGVFTLKSDGFTVAKAEVSSVESASITVKSGITKQALIDALPTTAIATINDNKKVELSTDVANASLPEGLIENGVVAAPADAESKEWTVTVPVNGSDAVKKPDGKALTVKVTVIQDGDEIVPEPTVSPINGTYDRYNGDVKLDADGSLKVTAVLGEGSKSGTKIWYKIDDGDATEYNESTGIVLKGEPGDQAIYFISVWAQHNSVKSDEVQCFYMLDDTLQQGLSIGCRDTALDDSWSASFTVTGDLYTTVNVTAPEKEGHVFDHWEWTGNGDKPEGLDLSESTLALTNYDPDAYKDGITAVYTPVLDSLEISMGYPATGKKLDQSTTQVSGTYKGSDRTLVDLMSYFADNSSIDIDWSPSDAAAKGNTAYTATLALKAGEEKKINGRTVKYAIADDVEVDVSDGNDTYMNLDASYKNNKLSISFPATEVLLHTVSFDTGKEGPTVASQTVEDGACAKEPDAPKMSGFTFEGWTYENGDDYKFDTKVTGDLKLCAKWGKSDDDPTVKTVYTVTFDSAGGSAVTDQEVPEGSEAEEPNAPTLDGFDFAGWFDVDGDEWDFSKAVTRNVTLYAHWAKNGGTEPAYLVIFDSAGGSAVGAKTVKRGDKVEKPTDPTYKGRTFEGWFTKDGKEEYDFDSEVTSDLTLYARWSRNGDGAAAHLVTFDANGGSAVAAQTVADGKCATEPEAPKRKGYDFTGWTLDGKAFDFSTPVESDLKLTASWKKRESKKDDADKGDVDSGDNRKGDETKTTTVTTVTTSADSNLAATGDRTPLIVGALAALGVLAAAAGIIAKRRARID